MRVQRDKGFGFVRYNTHEEAASAIQMSNGRIIRGKPIKVRKPFTRRSYHFDNHLSSSEYNNNLMAQILALRLYLDGKFENS